MKRVCEMRLEIANESLTIGVATRKELPDRSGWLKRPTNKTFDQSGLDLRSMKGLTA